MVQVINQAGTLDLTLSAGRMYVDGIQCEHEGGITYLTQPDLPPDPNVPNRRPPIPASGSFAAYLDVWDRHIGPLQDPNIRETALGGPDTATRAKTIWQVKFLTFPGTELVDLVETRPEWQAATAPSTGTMRARARVESSPTDPCIIPEAAGFRRLENQLYRVEIHTGGTLGLTSPPGPPPTFKWSRDNGSVVATWDDAPGTVNQIRVSQSIRDEALGFAQGQWVELSDDTRDLHGVPGLLVQVERMDGDLLTYRPATIRDPDQPTGAVIQASRFPANRTVRRWDMTSDPNGAIPITRPSPDGYMALESGVEVRFEDGTYKTGDYWLIPARTITSTIEWPTTGGNPNALSPQGIIHHFVCLASFTTANMATSDCRKVFLPLAALPIATPVADPPKPGQFRYYLLDGVAGNDGTGVSGVGPDPASALSGALPFQTFDRLSQVLPRDGLDSTAVVLIKPLPNGETYAGELTLGLHGYRLVLIRGSNFVDDQSDRIVCAAEPTTSFPDGVLLDHAFFVPTGNPREFEEELVLQPTGNPTLPEGDSGLAGQRARIAPDALQANLRNRTGMVLRSTQSGFQGQPAIHLDSPINETIVSGTRLLIESPGVRLSRLNIFNCGSGVVHVAGISANLLLVGQTDGEVAFTFCNAGIFSVSDFNELNLTPTLPGLGGSPTATPGRAVSASRFSVSSGRTAVLRSTFFPDGTIGNIGNLDIATTHAFHVVVTGCPKASIGTNLLPRDTMLGRSDTSRPCLELSGSEGAIHGVSFENAIPPTEDPNAAVTVSGHALDLEIVNVIHDHQGDFLSLENATAAEVRFDPTTLRSGLIRFATRTAVDALFTLTKTDVFDFLGNHVQGPVGGSSTGGLGSGHSSRLLNSR